MQLLELDAATVPGGSPALAARVGEETPDLVCIHGVFTGFRWRQRCADLARRCGLVVVGGGRPAGGVLVLSTLGVDVTQVREVAYGRGAGGVLAALRHRGEPFVLAAAHLVSVEQRTRLTTDALALAPGVTDVRYSVRGI